MPPPDAVVTITLTKVSDLGPTIDADGRYYALGRVANRQFGRSRTIAKNTASYTLPAENGGWSHVVFGSHPGSIDVALEVWKDNTDAAPERPLRIEGKLKGPWTTGRQEIVFGDGPKLHLTVETRAVPGGNPKAITLSVMPHEDQQERAVVRAPTTLIVELTSIRGLYWPKFEPRDNAAPKLAEYREGYISHDDQGRAYLSRDLAGAWDANKQQIELTAQVTVRDGVLPADAKMKWSVFVPRERLTNDPNTHASWREYILDLYYEVADRHGLGEKNLDSAWAGSAGKWVQVGDYTLNAGTKQSAETTITALTSKVTLKCPSIGGDAFIVRAEVQTANDSVEKFFAQTGVMTMWKRIDVELVRMDKALSIQKAVRKVPAYFEPACIQLDFTRERTLAGSHTKLTMVADRTQDLTEATSTWVNHAEVFTEQNKGGWFCLAAACLPHPAAPETSAPVPEFPSSKYKFADHRPDMWIVLRGEIVKADVAIVRFAWEEGQAARSVDFFVGKQTWLDASQKEVKSDDESAVMTILVLRGHPLVREFTGGDADGSSAHASKTTTLYFPKRQRPADQQKLASGGYEIPADAKIRLLPPGVGSTSGISPPKKHQDKLFYAGRTILFTHHDAYAERGAEDARIPRATFDDEVLQIVVHELTHAFGMPHMCGYWDYRTPRDRSCAMNYPLHWIFNESYVALVPGSNNKVGNHLCARHIMELRKVPLEKNPTLGWA